MLLVLANTTVVIIFQYKSVLNQDVVHFKLLQCYMCQLDLSKAGGKNTLNNLVKDMLIVERQPDVRVKYHSFFTFIFILGLTAIYRSTIQFTPTRWAWESSRVALTFNSF